MIILGYFLAVFMGLTLGLIGAGGSILSVPILVYFLDVPPVIATGYSLLLVGSTALIGGINYYRKKQVDIKTTINFAIPSLLAVYATRRWLIPSIPEQFFTLGNFVVTKDLFIMMLFAAVMLLAAIMMIRSGSKLKPNIDKNTTRRSILIGAEGAIIGVVTGAIGAGGGFLIIPTLVLLVGLDMKIAIGSSLLIIAAKSLFGFIGDLQSGIPLDYALLITFLICTLTGMVLGTILSKYIESAKLKKGFGWFTLCMGIIIIFKEL